MAKKKTEAVVVSVVPSELDGYVVKAKEELGIILGFMKQALQHARAAGEWLLKAKTYIQLSTNINYREWCKPALGISDKSADNYIRVYQCWDSTIKPALEKYPDMTLTDALALIKGPGRKSSGKSNEGNEGKPAIGAETAAWEDQLEQLELDTIKASMKAHDIIGDPADVRAMLVELAKLAGQK